MQIASRVHQVRLEHSLSLDGLALKTGLSKSLLASFENGHAVPTLEMFDRLAAAVRVPVAYFFYDDLDSRSTPRLTPRLTLQALVDGPAPSPSAVIASFFTFKTLTAITRVFWSTFAKGDREQMGTNPNSNPFSNQNLPAEADSSEDKNTSAPGS